MRAGCYSVALCLVFYCTLQALAVPASQKQFFYFYFYFYQSKNLCSVPESYEILVKICELRMK